MFGGRLSILFVYALSAVACMAWSWYAGKDINWDLLNYHAYVGQSVLTPRWGQDFLAASIQSYLNPYAYVPFAAMLAWGWTDILIGSTLAAFHALNLVLVWMMAKLLIPGDQRLSFALRCLATILAGLSPVFLQEVGTSFIDVSTAVLCLLGWYLLLLPSDDGRRVTSRLLWSGLWLGVATGLKLTNAVFAISGFFVVAVAGGSGWSDRVRRSSSLGSGLLAGFIIAHGFWGWHLVREFGNPFFPFFNAVFHSPDFPSSSIVHFRFRQESLLDSLIYLFRIALPERGVYTEPSAPDVRVGIVAAILAIMAVLRALWRRNGRLCQRLSTVEKRVLATFILSWVLWIATTGNGRYAIPVLLLTGPVLVWAMVRILPWSRWVGYALALVLVLQGSSIFLGTDFRWNPNPWGGQWINVDVPRSLVERPVLMLSMDTQSAAFLVKHVHPHTGFVNVGGQYAIGPGKPGFEPVSSLIGAGKPARMIVGSRAVDSQGNPIVRLSAYAGTAARFGYRIDDNDCSLITVQERLERIVHSLQARPSIHDLSPFVPSVRGRGYYLTCSLVPLSFAERRRYEEDIAAASTVLDSIEDHCPKLFRPRRPVTEVRETRIFRRYLDTDAFLWFQVGKVGYRRWPDELSVELGEVNQLLRAGAPPVDCSKRPDPGLIDDELDQLRALLQ